MPLAALLLTLHLALPSHPEPATDPTAPRPTPPSLPERPCPAATRCVGLRLHLAVAPSPELMTWLETQLDEANALFLPADLAFTPTLLTTLPPALATITTRDERDALGHDRFAPGAIDVYIVSRLGDVDIPGAEIRGVHWRSRRDRARRYIILSTISPPKVLAHELGHYFGLPHSSYPESIMNKTWRESPPPEERRFARPEVRRILHQARSLLASGALIDQRGGPAPAHADRRPEAPPAPR